MANPIGYRDELVQPLDLSCEPRKRSGNRAAPWPRVLFLSFFFPLASLFISCWLVFFPRCRAVSLHLSNSAPLPFTSSSLREKTREERTMVREETRKHTSSSSSYSSLSLFIPLFPSRKTTPPRLAAKPRDRDSQLERSEGDIDFIDSDPPARSQLGRLNGFELKCKIWLLPNRRSKAFMILISTGQISMLPTG